MTESPQPPLSFNGARPVAALVDTTARWFSEDDDLALGCECADPSLQIERWGQEVLPFPQGSS
ncbi:MAG: hypothetical protein JWQ07_3835 [Ramlibacter sp.]|nr:hypothetical protein [Ramlibacter sp.]